MNSQRRCLLSADPAAAVKGAAETRPPAAPCVFRGFGAHGGLPGGGGERLPSGGKASRRDRDGPDRVDRDGVRGSGIIDTIGPPQADEPLSVALAKGHGNTAAP